MPFGGGVRRCIGAAFAQAEIENVLSAVLRTVDLDAVQPADESGVMRNITMIPRQGARVRVVRRHL
jgi:cytochrome P450